MTDTVLPTYFASISSIIKWGDVRGVFYLNGDTSLPYTLRSGRFYYFAFDGHRYNLVLESKIDLNERKI